MTKKNIILMNVFLLLFPLSNKNMSILSKPNGTAHRLSLDQRIELELGVKLRNTPPPTELHSSCYYPPYNVSHYPYAPGGVVQVRNWKLFYRSTVITLWQFFFQGR